MLNPLPFESIISYLFIHSFIHSFCLLDRAYSSERRIHHHRVRLPVRVREFNHSINKRKKETTKQTNNPLSINQSVNQSIDRSINQSINQLINQSDA